MAQRIIFGTDKAKWSMKTDWIPKEHGAWGMIGGSFLSVVAVHGRVTPAMVAFLAGFLFLYFTRVPFLNIARNKTSSRTYRIIVGFGFVGWLLIILAGRFSHYPLFPLWVLGLVPFFLVELIFVRRRKPNHFIPQLVGTIGLSGIAALTDALWHGAMTVHALWLWLLNSIFFVAGITIVRQQIAARAPSPQGNGYLTLLRVGVVGYAALGVLWAVLPGQSLPVSWIVLLPVMAEVAVFSLNRLVVHQLKTLGWLQIAQTVIFVLFLALLTK